MPARIHRPLKVIEFNANGIWRQRHELRLGGYELVVSQSPSNKGVSKEEELLRAVIKKRLVKTEDFMCVTVTVICGVCKSVRLI
jgi:hypothetical protein